MGSEVCKRVHVHVSQEIYPIARFSITARLVWSAGKVSKYLKHSAQVKQITLSVFEMLLWWKK